MSFQLTALNCTDSYKLGHHKQYPAGTECVYSNFTARSNRHFNVPAQYKDDKIVWFGLQGALMEISSIWDETFFSQPKEFVVEDYKRRVAPFTGEANPDTSHIEALHDLGYLPIMAKAIDEGERVNLRIPLFTIVNTDPRFYWITNYLETWLSNEIWKPATVATIAYKFREILEKYADLTGAPKDFVLWQGHDFSCRGMSGMYDSAKSGVGHLLSFTGSDTLSAVDFAEWAYGAKKTFVSGSVPATEHSVMTMGGEEGEEELFERIITEVNPTGIVSLVSDSYDLWNVVTNVVTKLKDKILARGEDQFGNAKVVIRPDSGVPVDILCGTVRGLEKLPDYAWPGFKCMTPDGKFWVCALHMETTTYWEEFTPTPEEKGVVQCLWDVFGGTVTEKGFRVLDRHIGTIYGDSITMEILNEICIRLMEKCFASCNAVFGIGSFSYSLLTRDTLGFAIKTTYGEVLGESRTVFKAPKTDSGMKYSARGLLQVEKLGNGEFVLNEQVTAEEELYGELKPVYQDGTFLRTHTLEEIRNRLWNKS